jgi:hypothetical protein
MAESPPSGVSLAATGEGRPPIPEPLLPWRGCVAFGLLAVVGAMGPDITPSRYWPNLDHYIPRYVLLALSVGFGLSAVRSGRRLDRVFGIAVLVVGCGMVVHIASACLRITGG